MLSLFELILLWCKKFDTNGKCDGIGVRPLLRPSYPIICAP